MKTEVEGILFNMQLSTFFKERGHSIQGLEKDLITGKELQRDLKNTKSLRLIRQHVQQFLGAFECMDGVSTDSFLHYIKDIHQRTLLDGQKMVAMGFDEAAGMKCLAQKLTSEIAPNAIYAHCFAHCNELIVKDAIRESG